MWKERNTAHHKLMMMQTFAEKVRGVSGWNMVVLSGFEIGFEPSFLVHRGSCKNF